MDGAHTTNPTRGRKTATPTPGVAVLRLGGFSFDRWVKNKLDFSGQVCRAKSVSMATTQIPVYIPLGMAEQFKALMESNYDLSIERDGWHLSVKETEEEDWGEEGVDWEWEYYDEEKITEEKLEEIKGFRHKDYTLFEKTIKVPSGKIRIVRFFSKAQPEDSEPIELPKGYVVKVNKKTGVPYLKKKK